MAIVVDRESMEYVPHQRKFEWVVLMERTQVAIHHFSGMGGPGWWPCSLQVLAAMAGSDRFGVS